MRTHAFAFLTALALLAPATLVAQEEEDPHHGRRRGSRGLREVSDDAGRSRRDGFWLSAGLGAGGESFDARDGLGWSDDQGGGVGFVKLGGTVSPSLLIGAEAQVWGRDYSYDGYERGLGSFMGVAQFYPARRADFWIRGGIGWARDYYRDYAANQPTRTVNGTAYALGFGYDVAVARKVSITPSLDFVRQHYDTHRERIVSIGVAVTFH